MKKKLEGLRELEYKGTLQELQLYGASHKGKRYVNYEVDPFNEYQNFLYKRALMGLKIYSPEEIASMPEAKKSRVRKIYNKTQRVLNVYKQEVVNIISNNIFKSLFPNSSITKALETDLNYTDQEFTNTMDFKSLKINKKQIVDRLIREKILPSNFYELKGVTLHE